MLRAAVVLWVVSAGGVAAAQQPEVLEAEPPRPFARGTSMGGLVFGLGTGGDRTVFTFGGSYGYFVLDGIAPGLQAVVTAASDLPTTVELAPFVRIVPWRHYPVAPIMLVKGGRLFVDGFDDLWEAGGGGGLVFFASPKLAVTLEVIYLRYFPDTTCGLHCDDTSFSGGIGAFF